MLQNATYIGTGTEGSKYEKVQDILESKTTTASNNNGDENSGGPFDQVIINFKFSKFYLFLTSKCKS